VLIAETSRSAQSALRPCVAIMAFLFALAPLNAQGPSPDQSRAPESSSKPQLVLQKGHTGAITSVVFSPDGKFLATAGEDATIKIWEASTGLELRSFRGNAKPADALAISPDGKVLASGGQDFKLRLWDFETGQQIRTMDVGSIITALAFSGDGRWLAAGLFDRVPKIWDAAADYASRDLEAYIGNPDPLVAVSGGVTAITFSPDAKLIAGGRRDKTVGLWDVASGKLKHVFTGAAEPESVSFSADGRQLAAGPGDGKIRIWSVDEGYRLVKVIDQEEFGKAVAFSPDGRFLISTGSKGGYVWDAVDFHQIRRFEADRFSLLTFAKDGRFFATASHDVPQVWDAETTAELQFRGVHASPIGRIAMTADGKWIAVEASNELDLWNWSTSRDFEKKFSWGRSPSFTRDGTSLAFVEAPLSAPVVALWDMEEQASLRPSIDCASPLSATISPDGALIACFAVSDSIKILDALSGKERMLLKSSGVDLPAFSPDGQWVAYKGELRTIVVKSLSDGHEISLHKKDEIISTPLTFSPDGQLLAFPTSDGVGFWDFAGPGALRIVPPPETMGVSAIRFSPSGKLLAVSGFDNEHIGILDLLSVASGTRIATFQYTSTSAADVLFTPDENKLITRDYDGFVRIWDLCSGKIQATLAILATPSRKPGGFDASDWAVVDTEGRYDASSRGLAAFHWVVGDETIELSQLKTRYYEPGLLQKLLGFDKEPLRDVPAYTSVALYPSVQSIGEVDSSGKLRVELTNRGGGIGRVQVFVNDKEFLADARESDFNPGAARATLAIDLSGAQLALGEENSVRVVAWNQEGYLSSRPVRAVWKPAGAVAKKTPDLYAIIAGISDYSSPELQLKFAAKDADNMARAIEIAGIRLFGREHVHLTLLSTTGNTPELQPSKSNLQLAFEQAQKSKLRDILVVYLAGHGVARKDTYAYPTKEARTLDLSDPAILAQSAVTSDELVDWIKKVPARHQVMILDTCAAGLAAAKFVEKRGVPGEQIRALDRLKDRTGFQVLMGSAADSPSYEASQFGEGLLTYSLLQGMKGAALRDDEFVDVNKLFQYAADRVPQLAQNIGGIQRPQILALEGTSFDVGQLLKEDKEQIPLAVVKPMILRPVLLNLDAGEDNLGLMPALRKRLRDESYTKTRGDKSEPTAIFVDEEEMPGAIRPTGTYTVTDKSVVVNLVLNRSDKKAKLRVQGSTDEKDALVSKILDALLEASKTL
jgi:WD40 repeat protein